jgi:hypothetical protein
MLRFYVRFTLVLTLLLVVYGMTLIAFGSTQPINPALYGFIEGCEGVENLCWYGIVDSRTNLEIADEILTREGYTLVSHTLFQGNDYFSTVYKDVYERSVGDGCNTVHLTYDPDLENPRVNIATLENCRNIYAADIVDIFGDPRYILFRYNYSQLIYTATNEINFPFRGNVQLYSSVRFIQVNYQGSGGGGIVFDWQGFLPFWHYCLFWTSDNCMPF